VQNKHSENHHIRETTGKAAYSTSQASFSKFSAARSNGGAKFPRRAAPSQRPLETTVATSPSNNLSRSRLQSLTVTPDEAQRNTTAIMPNYVVEHMEPEIGPWSTLEYIAIANETTADSTFYISSLHDSLAANMPETLKPILESNPRFVATNKDITTLAAGVPKERICLLDPRAEKTLSPEDSGEFDWFVFGGILGG
jgi:hypothetical protein